MERLKQIELAVKRRKERALKEQQEAKAAQDRELKVPIPLAPSC